LPKASVRAVEAEGQRVARFWHADLDSHEIRMTPIA
jgi:hypothetical protein